MTEQPDESPVRERRVVVGVDGSEGARAALRFALEEAARRGVPVQAVTAYRAPSDWMDFDAVGEYEPPEAHTVALQRAEQFVERVRQELPQPTADVRVVAALGSPSDVLLRESLDADLLVVGSRGHGGFSTMLIGSTGMQCVLHATCPVTVVHAPEAHHHRLRLRREHASRAPAG
jgi:nucleotide-binding universal stress UspA family protein